MRNVGINDKLIMPRGVCCSKVLGEVKDGFEGKNQSTGWLN